VPPADGTIAVTIEDDGPGIPVEEIDRVFEPFHRLEESRNRETGGVGLGLPIARNMLRAHGGDVVLKNRPECGLKAIVTLPV
jgi:signal transduction histidine kinase